VELVKDDEMARLMAKCVMSWKFVLSFNVVVFGIFCYVFLLSSSLYIYIYESYVIIRSMNSHFKTWIQ
jgi:hypothetical protein